MATGEEKAQVGDHTEGSQDMDLTCIEGGANLPESTHSLINYKFPMTSTPGFGRGIFNPMENPFFKEDRKPGGLGSDNPSGTYQAGKDRMDMTSDGSSGPSGAYRESRKREYPGDEYNQGVMGNSSDVPRKRMDLAGMSNSSGANRESHKREHPGDDSNQGSAKYSGIVGKSSEVSRSSQDKASKVSWEKDGDRITERLQQVSVGQQQDPEGIRKKFSWGGYQGPRSLKLAALGEQNSSQQPVNLVQAEQGNTYYMGPAQPSLASESKLMKPRKTPASYNGTTAWRSYVSHFEVCARLNSWTLEEMGMYLAASLDGAAQEVLTNLEWNEKADYFKLVQCLEQRFDPEHQEEMFRAELKSRVRKPKETIPELVQDIRKLARRAYPNAASALLETLTKDHFMDAIVDPDMRWKIFQSRPGTLDEAARTALEFEVFQKAEAQRSGKKFVRMAASQEQKIQTEDKELQQLKREVSKLTATLENIKKAGGKRVSGTKKKGNCFNCGEEGHFKYECPRRNSKPTAQKSSNQGNL